MGKQQQGKKGRRLPLQAATTSSSRSTKSTHTQQQQQQHKGINFAGGKPSQSNTQSIIIDIIRKWRRNEPKQPNGEPLRGSLAMIVKEDRS